jgi:hypothetical protein
MTSDKEIYINRTIKGANSINITYKKLRFRLRSILYSELNIYIEVYDIIDLSIGKAK